MVTQNTFFFILAATANSSAALFSALYNPDSVVASDRRLRGIPGKGFSIFGFLLDIFQFCDYSGKTYYKTG